MAGWPHSTRGGAIAFLDTLDIQRQRESDGPGREAARIPRTLPARRVDARRDVGDALDAVAIQRADAADWDDVAGDTVGAV